MHLKIALRYDVKWKLNLASSIHFYKSLLHFMFMFLHCIRVDLSAGYCLFFLLECIILMNKAFCILIITITFELHIVRTL